MAFGSNINRAITIGNYTLKYVSFDKDTGFVVVNVNNGANRYLPTRFSILRGEYVCDFLGVTISLGIRGDRFRVAHWYN